MNSEFDEIRPYRDEEVPAAISRLLKEPSFHTALRFTFPDKNPEEMISLLRSIRTVDEFQSNVISKAVRNIQISTTKGIRQEGLHALDPQQPYLFVSNHRDIVLDSAFLNYLLFTEGFPTTRIAIGNNLLQKEWISDLVRLNKNFIVHRDVPSRLAYDYSLRLSRFIRQSVEIDNSSLWIAQKEGRTKDGSDKTHPGLLKMFGMAWDCSLAECYSLLNLVPLSISYEYEPCAGMKAFELYCRDRNGSYSKAPGEDLLSMKNGISHKKGRVVFSFGTPLIKADLDLIFKGGNKNEEIKALASFIDGIILRNYCLFPFHFLAYDMLNQTDDYRNNYTPDDISYFEAHMIEQLSPCKAPLNELKPYFLQIYANPVMNKLSQGKTNSIQQIS